MTVSSPRGLTKKEFDLLSECANEVSGAPPEELLKQAGEHLENARKAYAKSIFVNIRLAKAVYRNFEIIVDQWETLPGAARPWLRGAMRYFALSSDLEDDFTSPIGFDDDVDIMNACLKLAGREDLGLDPEDFDDV
ncbi:MAG: hypothetical protein GY859_44545 [Desulfobacterales bacterium]|nr:hypothetical protein [Desulfobacterales bacterium]